jgi:hypothetical protein
MPRAPKLLSGKRRILAAIENLESRQLLTAYFVDSETALAAINGKDLNAGDVVLLKGGTTFTTKLTLDAGDSGSASNPVLITSYNPSTRTALTDSAPSSARATLKAASGDALFIWGASGISIDNLNVTGGGTTTSSRGSGIHYWTDTAASNITIDNVDASNFREYGIAIGASDATLTNVRVTHVRAWGNGDGIATYAHGGKLISNFYLGHSEAYNNPGLSGASEPTGGGIELGGLNGAVIEYNEAYGNGAIVDGPAGQGIWFYDSNDLLVQYNESHHNTTQAVDGGGFDFDGGVTNSVMQYNYSHDNAGAGYGLYQYANAPTWDNNVIRNNVSVNDGLKNNYAAIHFWTAGGAMSDARIEGNQVIKSDGNYIDLASGSPISGTVVTANLFSRSGTPNLAGMGLNGPEQEEETPVTPVEPTEPDPIEPTEPTAPTLPPPTTEPTEPTTPTEPVAPTTPTTETRSRKWWKKLRRHRG